MSALRVGLLTISTSKAGAGPEPGADPPAGGEGDDESGRRLRRLAEGLGADAIESELIPDDRQLIEQRLVHMCDVAGCDLVLTTGGTGFSPTDVTPEATLAVIGRPAPGLAEGMRLASSRHTRHWMLSRAVAGIRGTTLVVNFPGSPAGVSECGEAISAVLPHALELIAGRPTSH